MLAAVPAGLTAAIYAARAGKTVAVLERETPGGQIVSAPLVENYPGILSISGAELAQKMTEQAKSLGAELLSAEATGLSKTQNGFLVSCADGALEARTVILATGASHRKLGLSQEDALTGCGISYCAVCDGAFYEGADVAVVGGGDTALQDALFLANTCRSVTLIHRRDAFRASAQLVRRAQAQENIRILQSCTVQKLLLSDDSLQGAELFNGKILEKSERIYVEGLFIAVGQTARRARLLKMPLQPKTDTIWRVRIQKQACRASLQPATDAKSRCASSRPPSRTGQRPRSRHAAISMPGKVNPDNSSHSTAKAADLRRQLFCSF